MNLGVRAHDCGKASVEELAKKVSEKGFTCVHLALNKAIEGIDTGAGKLNPGMAYYIREAFYRNNVQIAVLGCYLNLAHPDKEERRKIHERYKEHIRFARDFGCSVVGTETGSINGDYSRNEKNKGEEALQIFIDSLREVVKEAEKFGVFVAIEGVTSHIVCTPERMKKVLDAIDSNNLQVIFDPVNLIDIDNYKDQDEMMKKSFELFGDRIVTVHAKDFIIKDGAVKSVPSGKGLLNYDLLMKLIKTNRPYVNVTLEDNKPEEMKETKKFMDEAYARA